MSGARKHGVSSRREVIRFGCSAARRMVVAAANGLCTASFKSQSVMSEIESSKSRT